MFRKSIGVLLLVLMLCASLVPTCQKHVSAYTAWADGFEWGPDGTSLDDSSGTVVWTVSKGALGLAEIDTSEAYSGSSSGHLYSPDNGSHTRIYKSMPHESHVYGISAWIRKEDTSCLDFWHGDGSFIMRLTIEDSERLYLNNMLVGDVVLADTWYHFDVSDIDWTNHTCDFDFNGVQYDDVAMQAMPGFMTDMVGFASFDDGLGGDFGSIWVDDFAVTKEDDALTVTTLSADNRTTTSARLYGMVTSCRSGGCNVTVYWGDNDGATVAGNWDHSSSPDNPSQPQTTGLFFLSVDNLTQRTVLYYRASVTDSVETVWSPKTASHTNASIFYLDQTDGNDATTTTPLGWWSVAYTSGNGTQPVENDVATGSISGSTASVTWCAVSGGTWAAGTATGTLYWYGKSAAFAAENLTFPGGAWCTIGGDFTYCAWRTFTSGATAGRISPGDEIRVAKSPAPVNTGENATWTNASRTVTLTNALTANIDMCETAWTPNALGDTMVTRVNANTYGKEGTYNMQLTLDASPQVSTMQAYYDIPLTDFSSYQKISFPIRNSAAIAADQWVVRLCSDNFGAVAVDEFAVSAIASAIGVTAAGVCQSIHMTLPRNGGGNLGVAIESISIATGTVAPTASSYIYVDDFIACTTDGLNLQSLISKSNLEQATMANPEGWYAIKSINGVTINIDCMASSPAGAGRGYYTEGTSPETVPLYKRETIKTSMASAVGGTVSGFNESGTWKGYDRYLGGFDPVTNLQNGVSYFDGQNGVGGGFRCGVSYIELSGFGIVRYYWGTYPTGVFHRNDVLYDITCNTYMGYTAVMKNCDVGTIYNINNNNSYGLYWQQSSDCRVGTIVHANSNGAGAIVLFACGQIITDNLTYVMNNGSYGVWVYGGSNNCLFKYVDTRANRYGVAVGDGSIAYIWNLVQTDTNKTFYSVLGNDQLYVLNYQGIDGNHWLFCEYGTVSLVNSVTHGDDGVAWKFNISDSTRIALYPLRMPIARVYCEANENTTVSIWCKQDNSISICSSIFARRDQLAGLTVDQEDIHAPDCEWEELSLTFCPTESGVVEIEGRAWWYTATTNANAYFDTSCTVTTKAVNHDVVGSDFAILGGDIDKLDEYTPFFTSQTPELSSRGFCYDTNSGFPYADNYTEEVSHSNGSFTENITGLTPGELYYYLAFSSWMWGTIYGSELTFLTHPEAPSAFSCNATTQTQNNLGWTLGTGTDNTIVRGEIGSFPTGITDGTLIYHGTGTSCNHTVAAGAHWYYRAWSLATEGGLSEYSIESAMDSATFVSEGLPACPDNITISEVDDTMVLTWNIGAGSDNTLVVRKLTGYPSTYLDGDAVYFGNDDNFTDILGFDALNSPTVYYRLWGSNTAGLSSCYGQIMAGGAEVSDAVTMIAVGMFFLVGICFNGVAWWRGKWWVCPLAFFFWVGLSYYCYTQAAEAFDFYRFLTWACAGFAIISLAETWFLRDRTEEHEDTMAERYQKRVNGNLSQTFRSKNYKPPRRPPYYGGGLGDGLE